MKAAPFSFDEYQVLAMRTASADRSRYWAAFGIASEAGEVCDAIKDVYEKETEEPGHMEAKLKEECGDVLWYLALMCRALDCSLAEIAEGNIKKLEERHLKHLRPTPPERPTAKQKARGKRKAAK